VRNATGIDSLRLRAGPAGRCDERGRRATPSRGSSRSVPRDPAGPASRLGPGCGGRDRAGVALAHGQRLVRGDG